MWNISSMFGWDCTSSFSMKESKKTENGLEIIPMDLFALNLRLTFVFPSWNISSGKQKAKHLQTKHL